MTYPTCITLFSYGSFILLFSTLDDFFSDESACKRCIYSDKCIVHKRFSVSTCIHFRVKIWLLKRHIYSAIKLTANRRWNESSQFLIKLNEWNIFSRNADVKFGQWSKSILNYSHNSFTNRRRNGVDLWSETNGKPSYKFSIMDLSFIFHQGTP